MAAHPKEALVQHALAPQRPLAPEVRAHLDSCPSCAQTARDLFGVASQLLQGERPVPAPDGVLAALRAEMTGPGRLARFTGQVAAFLDIDTDAARSLLASVDAQEGWLSTPGVSVRAVPTGPRAAQALATLCRIEPGSGLDDHGHDAPEETLVLEGGFADSAGREFWPGESLTMPAGSHHALWALPGVPCLCLVLARLA
ncbi:MAG: cupin domain-containing protein [Myxococcaceae bacterium]